MPGEGPGARYATAGGWPRTCGVPGRRADPCPAGGPAERFWRWCKRQPVVAGLVSAIVLLLLFGHGESHHTLRSGDCSTQPCGRERRRSRCQHSTGQSDGGGGRSSGIAPTRGPRKAAETSMRLTWASPKWTGSRRRSRKYERGFVVGCRSPGGDRPRGWEWFYQWALCHQGGANAQRTQR